MKNLIPTVLNSPKSLLFVSLFLLTVGQMVDLQVAVSGAPQWQRVVSGLFFYIPRNLRAPAPTPSHLRTTVAIKGSFRGAEF